MTLCAIRHEELSNHLRGLFAIPKKTKFEVPSGVQRPAINQVWYTHIYTNGRGFENVAGKTEDEDEDGGSRGK